MSLFYRAVLCEITRKYNSTDNASDENELLHELSVRLDWAGISDPHNKVYINPPNMDNIALIMFLFTASQLNKLFYCKNTGTNYFISILIYLKYKYFVI